MLTKAYEEYSDCAIGDSGERMGVTLTRNSKGGSRPKTVEPACTMHGQSFNPYCLYYDGMKRK